MSEETDNVGDMHEWLYGDPVMVRRAREVARSRRAMRELRTALIDSWVVPLLDRLIPLLATAKKS